MVEQCGAQLRGLYRVRISNGVVSNEVFRRPHEALEKPMIVENDVFVDSEGTEAARFRR
jgi:hypothetical protein